MQILKVLIENYQLSYQPNEKPAIDVEDVTEISHTIIITTEKMFKAGRS